MSEPLSYEDLQAQRDELLQALERCCRTAYRMGRELRSAEGLQKATLKQLGHTLDEGWQVCAGVRRAAGLPPEHP